MNESGVVSQLAAMPAETEIVCRPCWGDKAERCTVLALNVFSEPAVDDGMESLCEQQAELLAFSDGFVLYYKEYRFDSLEMEVGVKFYSLREISVARSELKDRLSKAGLTSSWLSDYVPLAEPLGSGDLYLVRLGGCEVCYVDHEALFSPDFEPRIVSKSVHDFVSRLLESPISDLERYWRHYEDFMNQWVPVEVVA